MNKANKRKEKDVMKLLNSNYEIEIKEDNMSEFTVILDGPKESPYEGVSMGEMEQKLIINTSILKMKY